jgi:hypothetical protein
MALALTTLLAGLAGLLAIIREIAAALLATFVARLGSALAVIREIAAALLAALLTGLRGAFAILGKIALAASMFSHSCPPLLFTLVSCKLCQGKSVPKFSNFNLTGRQIFPKNGTIYRNMRFDYISWDQFGYLVIS